MDLAQGPTNSELHGIISALASHKQKHPQIKWNGRNKEDIRRIIWRKAYHNKADEMNSYSALWGTQIYTKTYSTTALWMHCYQFGWIGAACSMPSLFKLWSRKTNEMCLWCIVFVWQSRVSAQVVQMAIALMWEWFMQLKSEVHIHLGWSH
jgi:hypothetical protein